MNTNEVCLLCDKTVLMLGPGDWCASGAVLFEARPMYGSRFDSTLRCEQSLRIAICDDCLAARGRKISLVYRPHAVSPAPIVEDWDPTYDCNAPGRNYNRDRPDLCEPPQE